MNDTIMAPQQEWVKTKDEAIEQLFLKRFLPNFQINNQIKIALLLQLIAPEPINILLLGDPASGKTTILKAIAQLHEKARYCESARYLPPFSPSIWLRGIFADIQLLCFNKLDQASPEDQQILQELMTSEIAVLAAANPTFGRFDPHEDIYKQIDLSPTLINRFDLIFPVMDRPNRERDEEVASFILTPRKDPEEAILTELRKMFALARQTSNHQMTEAAIEELKRYYVTMRTTDNDDDVPSVAITPRQLDTLIKLSKAVARIHLSSSVTYKNAQEAIELLDYCLNQIAKDVKTGKMDIDR